MAEALSVRSDDPPRREPSQNQLAGEVKRKTRRLESEKPPEDLLQRLQATQLRPDGIHSIAPPGAQDDLGQPEHHWQMPNHRAVPTRHSADAMSVQSSHTLSDFEFSLNEEQLEQRLMNYHLRSDQIETMDMDIRFKRQTPGNDEEGRCPFVGTNVACDRCGYRFQLSMTHRGRAATILPPRNPGPWQRSQWLRTKYTPPSGVVEPRDPNAQVPASWNFPDPPLPALTSRRIHNNRDHKSGISPPSGQRTVLRMESPTTVPAPAHRTVRFPRRASELSDPDIHDDQDDLTERHDNASGNARVVVRLGPSAGITLAQYQEYARQPGAFSGTYQYPNVGPKNQSCFWQHELHQLEHRD